MAFQDATIFLFFIYALAFIIITTFLLFNSTFTDSFVGSLKDVKESYLKGLDYVIPFLFVTVFVINLIASYGVSSKPYYFIFAFIMLGLFYFLMNIIYAVLHYTVEDLGTQKEDFVEYFPITNFMISNFPLFGVVFVLGSLALSYTKKRGSPYE